MPRKLFLFLLFPAVFSLFGCGYRLTSDPTLTSPVSGKNIAIPLFVNKSYRANVGAILTGSMVDEFARRTGGKVTPEKSADMVLTGTVLSYSSVPIAYSATDTIKEYRALITIEASLTEKNSQKVVWKGILSWSEDYPAVTNIFAQPRGMAFQNNSTANNALLQNSEDAAIREIGARLAQQVYERVSSGF